MTIFAEFHHFGNILKVLGVNVRACILSVGKKFEPDLVNILCH